MNCLFALLTFIIELNRLVESYIHQSSAVRISSNQDGGKKKQ